MRKYQLPGDSEIFHLNDGETRAVYDEIFLKRCYVPDGIDIDGCNCIFDVGANIGLASLFFHRYKPGVRLFAFEPIPDIFEILSANVALHGVNAKVFNAGVSSNAGSANFTYYPNNTVMSGKMADPDEDSTIMRSYLLNHGVSEEDIAFLMKARFEARHVTCRLRTLSEIIRTEQVSVIDLLKIDVEKSEWEVVQGLEEQDWAKVRQIIAEVHDSNFDGFCDCLEARGFRVCATQDPSRANTGLHNVFARR